MTGRVEQGLVRKGRRQGRARAVLDEVEGQVDAEPPLQVGKEAGAERAADIDDADRGAVAHDRHRGEDRDRVPPGLDAGGGPAALQHRPHGGAAGEHRIAVGVRRVQPREREAVGTEEADEPQVQAVGERRSERRVAREDRRAVAGLHRLADRRVVGEARRDRQRPLALVGHRIRHRPIALVQGRGDGGVGGLVLLPVGGPSEERGRRQRAGEQGGGELASDGAQSGQASRGHGGGQRARQAGGDRFEPVDPTLRAREARAIPGHDRRNDRRSIASGVPHGKPLQGEIPFCSIAGRRAIRKPRTRLTPGESRRRLIVSRGSARRRALAKNSAPSPGVRPRRPPTGPRPAGTGSSPPRAGRNL